MNHADRLFLVKVALSPELLSRALAKAQIEAPELGRESPHSAWIRSQYPNGSTSEPAARHEGVLASWANTRTNQVKNIADGLAKKPQLGTGFGVPGSAVEGPERSLLNEGKVKGVRALEGVSGMAGKLLNKDKLRLALSSVMSKAKNISPSPLVKGLSVAGAGAATGGGLLAMMNGNKTTKMPGGPTGGPVVNNTISKTDAVSPPGGGLSAIGKLLGAMGPTGIGAGVGALTGALGDQGALRGGAIGAGTGAGVTLGGMGGNAIADAAGVQNPLGRAALGIGGAAAGGYLGHKATKAVVGKKKRDEDE